MKNFILLFSILLLSACNQTQLSVMVGNSGSSGASAADPRCLESLTPGYKGSGTEPDPYLICSVSQWNSLNTYCSAHTQCAGLYFKLGSSLSFSNLDASVDLSGFTSVDNTAVSISDFGGHIDGGNYLMEGIILFGNATDPTGLITNFSGSGSLKNFKIKNSYFNSAGADMVGALVGRSDNVTNADLLIENVGLEKVAVSGTQFVGGVIGQGNVTNSLTLRKISATGMKITSTGSYAGTVIGMGQAMLLEDITVQGSIEGNYSAGGIVGFYMGTSTFKRSTADVVINGAGNLGGLIGMNVGTATVEDCSAKALITSTTGYAGGLFMGQNSGSLSASRIKVSGTVSMANGSAGGFIGYNTNPVSGSDLTIEGAAVSGNGYVGGLNGANHGGFTGSGIKITGTINGSGSYTAGVFGMNTSSSSVNNLTLNAVVNGVDSVGGVVGQNNAAISGSGLNLTVKTTFKGSGVGGVIGFNTNPAAFTNLNLDVSITQDPAGATTLQYIGGMNGVNHGTFSVSGQTAKVKINLLGASDVTGLGSYIGYNTATNTLQSYVFSSKVASSGPITCASVNPLLGYNPNGNSTESGNAFSIDFSGLECL